MKITLKSKIIALVVALAFSMFIASAQTGKSFSKGNSQMSEYDKMLLGIKAKVLIASGNCSAFLQAESRIGPSGDDPFAKDQSPLDRAVLRSKAAQQRAEAAKYERPCNETRDEANGLALFLLVERNWDRKTIEAIGKIYAETSLSMPDPLRTALLPDTGGIFAIPGTDLGLVLPEQPVKEISGEFVNYVLRRPYIVFEARVSNPYNDPASLTEADKYQMLYAMHKMMLDAAEGVDKSKLRAVSKKPFEGISGIEYGGTLTRERYGVGRIYFVNGRILMIIAYSSAGRHPDIDRFLNSLQRNSFPELKRTKPIR